MRVNKQRVLVTGASGFTAQYLIPELERAGLEAGEVSREFSALHLSGSPNDETSKALRNILRKHTPEVVIHLAAISNPVHGKKSEIWDVNVGGTRTLLDAIQETLPNISKVIFASSSLVYQASEQPLTESSELEPLGDYAKSKYEAEVVCAEYSHFIPLVIARPFNYSGVGQAENFILPKLIHTFRAKTKVLRAGNLEVSRDFSDVRDISRYYLGLISNGTPGETYNLCSGKLTSLKDVLKELELQSGHSPKIEIDPELIRPDDQKYIWGDPSKLHEDAGLAAEQKLSDTLSWMLRGR
jgi:GDP-6-deoxy-D-talose 4-dehydrogenase